MTNTIRTEIEQQAAFYSKAKEAEKVLGELHQILTDGGYDFSRQFWTNENFRNGVFDVAPNGLLKMNVENVKFIENNNKKQGNGI
ncbi:MAG: hypothetical protein IPH58_03410 [Sphingobacteriales bacterium]|jgi:hypothetical protein|nr:hypothetical protein [Sphingobacteriales bacterium]